MLLKSIIYIKNKKSRKIYNFSKYFSPMVFLRDIYKAHLSLKDVNDKQSHFAAKIKNLDKDKEQLKNSFLK